ncbi:unnamed protein product [Mycena citricolor]|uniref:Uncharacterized protein n=1 Tax=Mycena citricolor TaxID=2018698 RepID=A0AAD2GUF9_9AGAR|nr:unnamed protein product [Mycena citricolor]
MMGFQSTRGPATAWSRLAVVDHRLLTGGQATFRLLFVGVRSGSQVIATGPLPTCTMPAAHCVHPWDVEQSEVENASLTLHARHSRWDSICQPYTGGCRQCIDISRFCRLTKTVLSLVIRPQLHWQCGQVCTNHPAAEKRTLYPLEESPNGIPHNTLDLSLPRQDKLFIFRAKMHSPMTKTELAKTPPVWHLSLDVLQQLFEHDL